MQPTERMREEQLEDRLRLILDNHADFHTPVDVSKLAKVAVLYAESKRQEWVGEALDKAIDICAQATSGEQHNPANNVYKDLLKLRSELEPKEGKYV
jgi:hypothetical protein